MHVLVICMLSVLLFGCVKEEVEELKYYEENITVQPNVTGALEFSVPSELPIAYVGKPYFYSFCDPQPEKPEPNEFTCGKDITPINPKGGEPLYLIEIHQITD